MSNLINVIFAIDLPVWNQLRSNFIRNENGQRSRTVEFSDEQEAQLRNHFSGLWKTPNTVGAPDVVVSWYVPDTLNDAKTRLKFVDDIVAINPAKIEVFGAWHENGAPYGTVLIPDKWDYSNPENPVLVEPEHLEGSPIYLQHLDLLSAMPDDIVYDEQGDEISRQPATNFKEVHKLMGWNDRIFI